MLEQELMTLAASGGTAVVTAAGTDAWNTIRTPVARWFGRGDAGRERVELERLDRTATILQQVPAGAAERAVIREEAAWQTRIENHLETLSRDQQTRAAQELRALLARHAPGAVTAGDGGVAVGGDLTVRAEGGSVAVARMGGVTTGDTYHGPTAVQNGNGNRQTNHFGR